MRGHEADGMRVAVAGGSIGGLAAATALRSVGCAVEVYERTPHQMTSRGAGIVVQPSLTALLSQVGASSLPTTRCTHRNYLSPNRALGSLLTRRWREQDFEPLVPLDATKRSSSCVPASARGYRRGAPG